MKTQYKDSQYTLKPEVIMQLINASKNLRDKLIIESAYFPALRREEITFLKVEDINLQEGDIIVRAGKGGKISPICVGSLYPEYIMDLKHYLEFIKRKEGYIFSEDGKKPLSLSRINQIFHDTSKIARLKHPNPKPKKIYIPKLKEIRIVERKINPHLMRHCQARHLKDMGFKAEFIKNYMRHEEIGTTMDMYGTLGLEEMKKIAQEKRGLLISNS